MLQPSARRRAPHRRRRPARRVRAGARGRTGRSSAKDAFKHYACRTKEADGDYTVRTATFDNGKQDAFDQGIGAYTAIARRSADNVVTHRTSAAWSSHYVRTTVVADARLTDRLWMQERLLRPIRSMVGRLRGQEARALRPALRALAVL